MWWKKWEEQKNVKEKNNWSLLDMVRITCEIIVNLRAENKEKKITGD